MANRIGTFPTFANLAPPWSLPTLDSNFVAVNSFANDSSLGFVNGILTDTGSPNAYIVTCPFGAPTAYNPGMSIAFTPANSNTGASTITVAPLGSVSILTSNGNPLVAGALQAGNTAFMVLIGTAFRLFSSTYNPLNQTPTITAPGTTAINCAGISALQVFANMAGIPGTYIFSLTNLAEGTVVDFTLLTNGSGKHIQMAVTDPTSAAYLVGAIYTPVGAGPGRVNLVNPGFDSSVNAILYHGVAYLDPTTTTPTLDFMAISY